MTDTSAVRLATAADEPAIMALCRLMWAENGMFAMAEDKVREKLAKAFRRDLAMACVIGEPGGELKACLVMEIGQVWYSKDWHLGDLINFVHPDHRQSNHANEIVAFAKKSAVDIGLPLLMGIVTNHRTLAKVRLLRRSLGNPVGAFFVHNSPWQQDETAQEMWLGVSDMRAMTRGGKRARRKRQRATERPTTHG